MFTALKRMIIQFKYFNIRIIVGFLIMYNQNVSEDLK